MSNKNRHIVVGAGPSGIMLCHTMLQRDDVILVERGSRVDFDSDSSAFISQPGRFYAACLSDSHSDMCNTKPQEKLANRILPYPQGKGLGGTSNINAMILTGGHISLFNTKWPKRWDGGRFERLFAKVIAIVNPRSTDDNQLSRMLKLKPNRSNSFSAPKKYQEKETINQIGNSSMMDTSFIRTSYYQCIQDNQRILLQDILLSERYRSNRKGTLNIIESSEVQFILVDECNRATGVLIQDKHTKETSIVTCMGDGEVILCAGAIESPRILHKSLQLVRKNSKKKGSNIINLPKLGQNLQDHIQVAIPCFGNWNVLRNINKDILNQDLQIAYSSNGVHGWVYLDDKGEIYRPDSLKPPSLQIVFVDGVFLPDLIPDLLLPKFTRDNPSIITSIYHLVRPFLHYLLMLMCKTWLVHRLCKFIFGVMVCNVQPHSRGSINFKAGSSSKHNSDSCTVEHNFLRDKRDEEILLNGIRTARKMISNLTSIGLQYIDMAPKEERWLRLYIRYMATSYFHLCGTCAMNKDSDLGVVNEEFQVHHFTHLRVIDASVIPAIPTGPISATCMALGIAGGEHILKK